MVKLIFKLAGGSDGEAVNDKVPFKFGRKWRQELVRKAKNDIQRYIWGDNSIQEAVYAV